jgi:pyrroloquinoline quinone biosynthesis protein A
LEHLCAAVDYNYGQRYPTNLRRHTMSWTKPAYTDLRIGFEVTMYFASR